MTSFANKSLLLLCAVAVFAVSGAMAASLSETPPPGSITEPKNRHNMSSNADPGNIRAAAPPDGTDQICIFCHTPHGAAAVGPLWNRNNPIGPAGGFKLYSGDLAIKGTIPGALNPTAPNVTKYKTSDADPNFVYPNGASRLCMSCHDGVTAINVLRDGTTIAMVANASKLDPDGSLKGVLPNVGAGGTAIQTVIDLSTSHPISFIYTDNIVNTIINPAYISSLPALPDRFTGPSGFNPSVDTPLDSQSRMQCTTCHDPHLDTSLVSGLGGLPPFWRQTTTVGSLSAYDAVCNNCHATGATPTTPVHPPANPPLP